MYYPIEGEGSN